MSTRQNINSLAAPLGRPLDKDNSTTTTAIGIQSKRIAVHRLVSVLLSLATGFAALGCNSDNKPKPKAEKIEAKKETRPVPERLRETPNTPPKIKFEPSTQNYSGLNLTLNISQAEQREISIKLAEKVKIFINLDTFKNAPSDPGKAYSFIYTCAKFLGEQHPELKDIVAQLNKTVLEQQNSPESTEAAYKMLALLNHFLVPVKQYIHYSYIRGDFDLHTVKQEMTGVFTNMEPNNEFNALNLAEGVRKQDRLTELTGGMVQKYQPGLVQLWPDRSIRTSVKKYTQDELIRRTQAYNPDQYAIELLEGTAYHEAIHVYLKRKFPEVDEWLSDSILYNLGPNLPTLDVTAKLISDSVKPGKFNTVMVEELCAVGAQLMNTNHPHIISNFVIEGDSSYRLVNIIIYLATIKHSPDPQFKADIIGRMRTSGERNDKLVLDHHLEQVDAELTRKIGQEMWNMGIQIFERNSK